MSELSKTTAPATPRITTTTTTTIEHIVCVCACFLCKYWAVFILFDTPTDPFEHSEQRDWFTQPNMCNVYKTIFNSLIFSLCNKRIRASGKRAHAAALYQTSLHTIQQLYIRVDRIRFSFYVEMLNISTYFASNFFCKSSLLDWCARAGSINFTANVAFCI